MKTIAYSLLLLFAFSTLNTAKASSIGSVHSPGVSKDQLEYGARLGYTLDDEAQSQDQRLRQRLHLDYGFTDWYASRLLVIGDKREGDNLELDNFTWENRFQFFEKNEAGWDAGLRLSYTYKDGAKKPDNLAAKFSQRWRGDAWEWRFNQSFGHEIGQDSESGLSFESRAQVTTKGPYGYRYGVESFNDFGKVKDLSGYSDQDHAFGPVVKGKFGPDIKFEAGYRFGISRSGNDHIFKIFLSRAID